MISSLTNERKVSTSGEERMDNKTSSERRTNQICSHNFKFTGKLEGINRAIFDINVGQDNNIKYNHRELRDYFVC